MSEILKRVGRDRLEFIAVVLMLMLATYCSLTLTTNAAVDSMNQRLAELREHVAEREAQAERQLLVAVLDVYPSLAKGEIAYNANVRIGPHALTADDFEHKRALDEVMDHYRPMMKDAVRSGVRSIELRHHMAQVMNASPYSPGGGEAMAYAKTEGANQF